MSLYLLFACSRWSVVKYDFTLSSYLPLSLDHSHLCGFTSPLCLAHPCILWAWGVGSPSLDLRLVRLLSGRGGGGDRIVIAFGFDWRRSAPGPCSPLSLSFSFGVLGFGISSGFGGSRGGLLVFGVTSLKTDTPKRTPYSCMIVFSEHLSPLRGEDVLVQS